MLIYTDGSCIKNNYGGWAFCIVGEEEDLLFCGSEVNTTNNRMELTAVIESLGYMNGYNIKKCTIITDSQLTMNCAKKMWKRNKNTDLWTEFDKLSKGFSINWKWVKAHNGDYYNELVDKEARDQANSIA